MKPFLTLLCLCCLSANLLHAQGYRAQRPEAIKYAIQRIKHPNHITISPFHFFDGTFMLGYERLSPMGAFRISPSITMRTKNHIGKEEQGWGLDLGYKFSFIQNIRRVMPYVGPYVFYRYLESKTQDWDKYSDREPHPAYTHYADYNVWSVGVEGGVKFIFGRFTMDIALGGGIRIPRCNGETLSIGSSDIWAIDYKGIAPKASFTLGITF
jgi:hypothetical protein